jgi:hypothetical protein
MRCGLVRHRDIFEWIHQKIGGIASGQIFPDRASAVPRLASVNRLDAGHGTLALGTGQFEGMRLGRPSQRTGLARMRPKSHYGNVTFLGLPRAANLRAVPNLSVQARETA